MELTKQQITKKLEKIALHETTPFCYGCYIKAPKGVCHKCGSDDLMRELEGSGLEYGAEWVYRELLEEALEPVDTEEVFEDMIDDCYASETKVGWINFDTVTVLKTMDEIAWELAKDEYIDSLVDEEELLTFDEKNYYWKGDVLNFIEKYKEKVA